MPTLEILRYTSKDTHCFLLLFFLQNGNYLKIEEGEKNIGNKRNIGKYRTPVKHGRHTSSSSISAESTKLCSPPEGYLKTMNIKDINCLYIFGKTSEIIIGSRAVIGRISYQ